MEIHKVYNLMGFGVKQVLYLMINKMQFKKGDILIQHTCYSELESGS